MTLWYNKVMNKAFTMRLADIAIKVYPLYEATKTFCQDYLTDDKANYVITITEDDITKEQEKSNIQKIKEGLEPMAYDSEYLETLALFRKCIDILLEENVILFHGSCVVKDNEAYLFTAPSGTGKSTHTKYWTEVFDNVVMLNDDKPLIRVTADNEVIIYGTPWMGKHLIGRNISAPLKAICFLNQGQENVINKVYYKDLYVRIINQTQSPLNHSLTGTYLRMLDLIGENVTFYEMSCTKSSDAATVAYQGMKN